MSTAAIATVARAASEAASARETRAASIGRPSLESTFANLSSCCSARPTVVKLPWSASMTCCIAVGLSRMELAE
eukprot:2008137-Pyramimonas_sp.AAC.1